jgi:hypothetical protein
MRGLEPPHLTAPDPKSGVYTNFTTSALSKKISGTPYTIRTCDRCLRRALLYPAELRTHIK